MAAKSPRILLGWGWLLIPALGGHSPPLPCTDPMCVQGPQLQEHPRGALPPASSESRPQVSTTRFCSCCCFFVQGSWVCTLTQNSCWKGRKMHTILSLSSPVSRARQRVLAAPAVTPQGRFSDPPCGHEFTRGATEAQRNPQHAHTPVPGTWRVSPPRAGGPSRTW